MPNVGAVLWPALCFSRSTNSPTLHSRRPRRNDRRLAPTTPIARTDRERKRLDAAVLSAPLLTPQLTPVEVPVRDNVFDFNNAADL
ncbi:MAG: hypothetical protein MHM6MM_001951 [Cercozoa sp. M6MM]